jgi:ATP-dependent DNA ligase
VPPYADRRALLEALDLDGPAWRTPEAFDDGEALLEATGTLGLEGVVAKKRSERYRPGERGWIKTKHRSYWRFGQELESAQRGRRVRVTNLVRRCVASRVAPIRRRL